MQIKFAAIGLMMVMGSISPLGFAQAAECTPSPATSSAADHAPAKGSIPLGNNLSRPAGKSVVVAGQQLRIHGRVLDRQCKPVIGAVIELWQPNRDGIYQVADRAALANPYAVFAGAGRTTTDNTGSFDFYTIFPGASLDSKAQRAPLVHIRLQHKDMKPLTTELYFADEQRNGSDPVYQGLSAGQRQALTLRVVPQSNADLFAETLLVMDGVAPYVQY